jgi:peptidoglycan/xylan/chitin deacetylase (PgdA/CDA1 family)
VADEENARNSLDPRGRIPGYGVFLMTTVVLGVSVGVLTYVQTMGNLFPWDGVLRLRLPSYEAPDPLAGFQPTLREGAVAHLLETPANRRCASRWRFDLAAESARWEALASRAGFQVERTAVPPGPDAPTAGAVWVVPWSLCLEEEVYASLDAWLRRGGGVVVGGPVHLARALEQGGPLHEWLGARRVKHLGGDVGRFLIAAHRTPPSARLEPGQRIALEAGRDGWAVDAPHPALYWSRWELHPLPAPQGGRLAAVAASRVGRGRLVWFGVPQSRALPEGAGGLGVASVLSLQWSAGKTLVGLAAWPRGRRHAFVFAVDVFGEATQIRDAARYFARLRLPATFFWYSDALDGSQALRPLVGPSAEIASRGDRPVPLAGHPRTEQERRLARSRRALERAGGRTSVRGVHPPNDDIDELTLHASAGAGYDYILGDPNYDRAYPRWARIARRGIAVLSRAGAGDDYEHVVRTGLRDPERVAKRFLQDLRRVQDLGGLYVLNLRPDVLGGVPLRPALDRILEEVRASKSWLTTAGEVSTWVRRRQGARVLVDPHGAAVRVVNEGAEPLEQLELEIYADEPTPRRVALPSLPPGEQRTLAVGPDLALAY